MTGTRFSLEVQPILPAKLARLEELANDLLYTWDRNVRSLFYRMSNKPRRSCNYIKSLSVSVVYSKI